MLVMSRNKFGHQYYSLIGGGVDIGETIEQSLIRELSEETGVVMANPRLVIIEDAGEIYGQQHIYQCDYVSGQPRLDPNSSEAKISQAGQNTYNPLWLPLKDLPAANLLPKELKATILECISKGFPPEPIKLTIED